MKMTIDDLASNEDTTVYDNDAFRRILEDHITLLKSPQNSNRVLLEKHLVYKYQFDLAGFLLTHNVPAKYHWITMRCNGLTSPEDSLDELTELLLPNFDTVEKIKQAYFTTNKIR